MSSRIEYFRQMEVFDRDWWNGRNCPVHVIGAGALGSWLVLMLAKLGIENIHVCDDDVVEAHNLPNQMYAPCEVGRTKADAAADLAVEMGVKEATPHVKRVNAMDKFEGVVFLCVDSMAVRREIIEALFTKKFNRGVEAVFEARMGLTEFKCYQVYSLTSWLETWYSDDDAYQGPSACQVSTSVIGTAISAASTLLWMFLNWVDRIGKNKRESSKREIMEVVCSMSGMQMMALDRGAFQGE